MIVRKIKLCFAGLTIVHRDVRVGGNMRIRRFSMCDEKLTSEFSYSIIQRYAYGLRSWQFTERVFRLVRQIRHYSSINPHTSLTIYRNILARLNINRDPFFLKLCHTVTSAQMLTTSKVQKTYETDQQYFLENRMANTLEKKAFVRLTRIEHMAEILKKRSLRTEDYQCFEATRLEVSNPRADSIKTPEPDLRQVQQPVDDLVRNPSAPTERINAALEPSRRSPMGSQKINVENRTAVNVEKLTEQVVRAIDQRIIAERERLGKS